MRYFQWKEYPVEAVLSEHMEKQFGTHNHVGHYVISLLLSGKAKVEMAGKEREYGVGEVEKERRQENQAEKEGLNKILTGRITAAIKQVYELHGKAGKGFGKEIAVLAEKMIAHSEQEIQMEDWEKTAFMSRYYLIRKFKSALGMTPHQFQIQNRIRRGHLVIIWYGLHRAVRLGSTYTRSSWKPTKLLQAVVNVGITEYG